MSWRNSPSNFFVRLPEEKMRRSPPLNLALCAILGATGVPALSFNAADIPGFFVPHYGEETFGETALPVNPYLPRPKFRGLGDMRPVAPLDAVNKPRLKSISSAAGVAPGPNSAASLPEVPYINAPDIVPTYQHPEAFPGEARASGGGKWAKYRLAG